MLSGPHLSTYSVGFYDPREASNDPHRSVTGLKATMVLPAYTILKPLQSLGMKKMLYNRAPRREGGWGKQDLTGEERGPGLQVQGTVSVSPAGADQRKAGVGGKRCGQPGVSRTRFALVAQVSVQKKQGAWTWPEECHGHKVERGKGTPGLGSTLHKGNEASSGGK